MTDFTHDPNQNSFSGQAQELSELIQAGGIQNGKLPDDLSAGPHTDLESAMESQGKQFNPPVPQTDSENAIEPEKPARKPRSRKSKTPEEPVSEPVPQEPEALPEDEESDAPAVLSTGEKTPRRAKKKIVAIDEERQVLTDADRIQNDLLDLVESMKIKRILTDSIRGVERGKTNPDRIYAVVYLHFFLPDQTQSSIRVERDGATGNETGRITTISPPNECLRFGKKDGQRKGFYYIIVTPQRIALQSILLATQCGKKQDWNIALLSHRLTDGKSIQTRHENIQQNRIVVIVPKDVQCLFSVPSQVAA